MAYQRWCSGHQSTTNVKPTHEPINFTVTWDTEAYDCQGYGPGKNMFLDVINTN